MRLSAAVLGGVLVSCSFLVVAFGHGRVAPGVVLAAATFFAAAMIVGILGWAYSSWRRQGGSFSGRRRSVVASAGYPRRGASHGGFVGLPPGVGFHRGRLKRGLGK